MHARHQNTGTGSDSCDPIPHTRAMLDYLRRVSILEPSRTGGGNHSLRANLTGRDPMIFGGRRFQHDGLCDPRRSMVVRRIVQIGGWITRRDWSYRANYIDARGAEVCMGLLA